jgi:hypothetical protein
MDGTSFKEKIRSINFGLPSHRAPKVTTERDSKLEATKVEHWDDRQDIHLKPKTIRVKGPEMEVMDG